MESELIPGYDFEYTLDGIIFDSYDKFLKNKYEINQDYIRENIDDLIILRDVVVPNFFLRGWDSKNLFSKRYHEDIDVNGQLGIYQWHNLFGHFYERNNDLSREDDIRLALDIANKYPEHSEIICLKEIQGDIYDTSPNIDNTLGERADQFEEALKPVNNMVDKVYSNLLNDDLINLDDHVPSEFLSEYAYTKRFWLVYTEKQDIFELENSYRIKLDSFDNIVEAVIFVMEEMENFIAKYPQYSQLIFDYNAFNQYYEKLKKELEVG